MTIDEAIAKVKGYLTDYLPMENSWEIEEIMKALGDEPYIFEKMGRDMKEGEE